MTSLNHDNNLCLVTLYFPTTSASGSGVPYCKSQETEIQKAKEELKKLESKSSDESEEHKKQIAEQNGKIKKAQDAKNDCAKTHNLPEGERNKGLEEVRQQREIVKKLSEFKDTLTKNDNILTHLCSGLETFLGFNSESKGYTGQGIVYSDLDRLCDGVMAFLSGVLGAVKDDENVKHYYPVTYMNNTIDCIKNSMHKGSSEYHSAVVAAAQALELWNGELVKRADAFRNKLTELQTNNLDSIENYLSLLNDLNGSSLVHVATRLANCISEAKNLSTAFDAAEKEYWYLDETLKDKLRSSFHNIKLQVKQFEAAANNKELKQLLVFSDEQAKELETAVRTKVMYRLNQLGSDINDAFDRQIKKPIKNVNEQLTNVEKDIKVWIKVAGTVVQEVKTKATEIHSRLVVRVNKIITDAKGVEDEADSKVAGMLDKVKSLLGDSRKNSAILDKAYREAREQLKWLHASGAAAFHTAEATANNVIKLNDKIKKVLAEEMHVAFLNSMGVDIMSIQADIGGLLEKVYGAIGNLSERIVGKNLKSIKDMFEKLNRDDIKSFKTAIEAAVAEFKDLDENTYPMLKFFKDSLKPNTEVANVFDRFNKALGIDAQGTQNTENNLADQVDKAILTVKDKVNQLQPDLESKCQPLKKAVQTLQQTLTHIQSYSERIVAKGSGLQAHVNELGEQLRKRREALSSLITTVENADITHHIGDVWNTLGDAKTIVVKYIRNAARHFNALTDELTKLQGELNGTKTNDVINRLNYLLNHGIRGSSDWNDKENAKGLTEIQKRIDGILSTNKDGNLKQILKDAKAFNTSVIVAENTRAMSEIQQYVSNEIARVTRAIQENAKDNYYRKIRTMFDDMKLRVQFAVTDIKRTINEDKDSGVKGLLCHLDGNLNINERPHLPENKLMRLCVDNVHKNVRLRTLSDNLQKYLDPLLEYIRYQVNDQTNQLTKHPINERIKPLPTPPPTDQTTDPATQLTKIKEDFDELLKNLIDENGSKKHNYNNDFVNLLSSLKNATNDLSPSLFANPRHPELLDAVKKGLEGFITEMERVYVNGYDGGEGIDKLSNLVTNGGDTDGKLTDDGRNFSKIFLTILETLVNDFEKLCKACNNNKTTQINLHTGNRLGVFLNVRGYDVAKSATSQDGELQNTSAMTGEKIKALTEYTIKMHQGGEYDPITETVQPIKHGITTLERFFGYLYDVLSKYRTVCHLRYISKPRTPTTIKQMLLWLNGLPYTAVYRDLSFDVFSGLFDKPKKAAAQAEQVDIPVLDENAESLDAYPQKFTATDVSESLVDVCHFAERVLICILGHGHAEGQYACEFSTNSDDLLYPGRGSDCLDMLVDILKRLYDQLYFLFIQCSRDKDNVSWRDCWYGQHVGGSDWRCNEKQCINQMVNQSADQNANQRCGQTCDRHPSCGLKSPLQSFLEDGLPGFLPHSIKKPGCKLECTVSNHRGLPCKTPMGFGDISVTASRASRGERMVKVLGYFCGKQDSPLTKLCGYFNCLLQTPPQTLGDMFAFFTCYLNGWNDTVNNQRRTHKKAAFNSAVKNAYFGVTYDELDVDFICYTKQHTNGDLLCLLSCDNYSRTTCGRFMQPFGLNTWNVFSAKNSGKYLSWIVYLTETFYNLLQQLYQDCCNNCDKPGTRCHGKVCPGACKVKAAYKSEKPHESLKDQKHIDDCKSIAACPFTRPTLAKYGFVLQSISNLSGENGPETKRTCQDLCNSLQIILNNKEADKHVLAEFVYRSIPNFLWAIRSKFFWTTIALWSLSLFYLIIVMVGRLDVLHIRSHLRIPSSHKITAQSLLAAAQVGRLAKISYLQP